MTPAYSQSLGKKQYVKDPNVDLDELPAALYITLGEACSILFEQYKPTEQHSAQCEAAIDMLLGLRNGIYMGTVGFPADLVAAGAMRTLQLAAAEQSVAGLMDENQRQFAAPDLRVSDAANALRVSAAQRRDEYRAAQEAQKSTRTAGNARSAVGTADGEVDEDYEAAQQAQQSVQNPIDELDAADGSTATPSAQTARPSLSVLQRGDNAIDDPLKSMATVPTTASSTVTIGSGTEAIDHFDVRNLGVEGVESVKVMHPLQQANLAKHQSMMLFDLFRSLVVRINRGRYGQLGRPDFEAVASSIRVMHVELQRRKMSVPDYVPIPQPLGIQAEQYGRHLLLLRDPSPNMDAVSADSFSIRVDAKVVQGRTDTNANALIILWLAKQHGGVSEPINLKNGFEGELKHPLTIDDLPAGLKERDILELKARLEQQNRRVHIDELVDRAIASRYRACKESIAAIDAWLASEQAAKDSLAEGAAPESGPPSDREDQPYSSNSEAGPSEKANGKRAVSFTRRGPTSPYRRPKPSSRASSTRPLSRGSYIPTGSPTIRPRSMLRNGHRNSSRASISAFMKGGPLETLEAQQQAQAADVEHANAAEMPPQELAGGEARVATPMPRELADDARAATQLRQKFGEVTGSSTTDKASNLTDDGSDVGNIDDVKSETAEAEPSVHEQRGKEGGSDDEDEKYGGRTPVGPSE
ncbi:hypothetical protein B0A55_05537 [Friedmanniomyces simplex]|uniref:Uncharacterized protein n=1 Tax=Friedmanniomyces simplex TaxID=329884 RepID=A0A4V5NG69_9PEZI|nr:hypothetical protein B0A55_05537 [Friedmanniomyces simplex]